MTTIPGAFAVESIPEGRPRRRRRVVRLFAAVSNAVLRRLRGAALRVLDLETEFEALG